MAIKRPSKSLGTRVRKTVSSPGLRHVDLKAPQQMVPGNLYVGWLCKSKACGGVIAVALLPEDNKAAAGNADDQLAAIKCPHCGNEDLYRWGARREHTYAQRNAGT